MRGTTSVRGVLLALAVVAVGGASVLGQVPESAAESRNRLGDCIATPVPGAPFSAEAVTTWSPAANVGRPELRVTARYFRDSAGRVRVDYVGGATPQRVMITAAADSQETFLLDTSARTANSFFARGILASIVGGGCFNDHFVLPLSMNRFVGFSSLTRPRFDEELLGQRSIEGIPVTGTLSNASLPVTIAGVARVERWVSPELQLVVYIRREDCFVGVVEHRLTKISRAEPPAALFEVPANFIDAEDDPSAAAAPRRGSLSWENPYMARADRLGPC